MSPPTHEAVYGLFVRVCDLPPADRGRMLDEACAGDCALREAVESLLDADESGRGAARDDLHDEVIDSGEHLLGLGDPAMDGTLDPAGGLGTGGSGGPGGLGESGDLGWTIGAFRVLRVIGEGGMGVVYEAEQDAPKRRVALKIIRSGRSSGTAVKRFRREAEMLGMLRHPGIAQIIESGTHGGRPYIAMEFVDGRSLVAHAEASGLGVRERLELVARVADAVHHAHQKGIIHRDLKPENVLVPFYSGEGSDSGAASVSGSRPDARLGARFGVGPVDAGDEILRVGQPKVLDFGIARASDGVAGVTASQTMQGQLVGTLAYMSPEQIAGDPDIDIRADVYALGVIAFELLAGTLPFRERGATLAEAILRQTNASPMLLGGVSKQFRGDIETIVSTAMQTDRSARYGSAAGLAADIRRYLACKPIEARTPSMAYQFRRFCLRNRALVCAASLAVAAVIVGSVVTGVYAAQSSRLLKAQEVLLYSAMLDSASRALAEHDVDLARTMLSRAPVSRRGWEWSHLHGRTRQVLRSVELGEHVVVGTHADVHWLDGGARFLLPVFDEKRLTVLTIDADTLSIESRRPIELDIGLALPRYLKTTISPCGEWVVVWGAAERPYTFIRLADGRTEQVERSAARSASRMADLRTRAQLDATRFFGPWGTLLTGDSIVEHPTLGRIGVVLSARAKRQELTIFSVDDRREIRRIPLTRFGFRPPVFSRGGEVVTAALENGFIESFDVATGAARPWEESRPSVSGVPRLAVTADGTGVVLATMDGRVMVFDASTGSLRSTGQDSSSPARALAPRPGRDEVLAITGEGRISVFGTSENERGVLRGHEHWVQTLTSTRDGATLVSGDWAGTIRVWDAASEQQIGMIRLPETGTRYRKVADLSISPDGSRLAVVWSTGWSTDHHVEIRDLASGDVLERVGTIPRTPSFARFSPDGSLIVTSYEAAFEMTSASARVLGAVRSPVVFSNRDPGLAVVGQRLGFRVFDPTSMRTIAEVRNFAEPLLCFAFSPDDSMVLACGDGTDAYVFRVRDGLRLATLSAHTGTVLDVAWSPDGSRLATASRDETVRIWDAATYDCVTSLYGHDGYVSRVIWPTPELLVSGSGDRTLRVWRSDSASGDRSRVFERDEADAGR